MGEPIITLFKRVPEELPHNIAWNHTQGSFFTTVNDWNNNRLRHTSFFDDLSSCDPLKSIHWGALDVMMTRDNDYAVCELNFSPAMTIQSNLQKVRDHVLPRY